MLKSESRDELATKADLVKFEGIMTVKLVAIIAAILFVNKDAIVLLAQILGLTK